MYATHNEVFLRNADTIPFLYYASSPLANNKICKQIPTFIIYKDGDINNPDKVLCNLQESEIKISDRDIYIKNIKEIAYGYDPLVVKGLTPQKIVADYLRYVHRMAVQKLKENKVLVSKENEQLFQRFKVEDTRYCIACPQGQIAFMGKCFIEAGIIKDENELEHRLHYVTESEATAYNLLAWDRRESKIKPSENYLVCNLGYTSLGISEIKADTTEALSQVKTVDEFLGEGSMVLDLAFSRLIREKDEALALDDEKKNTKNAKLSEKFASEKKVSLQQPLKLLLLIILINLRIYC